MKNIKLLSIIFFVFSNSIFAQPKHSSTIETTIRVWGVLKYYSPYVYSKKIDWDNILVKSYNSIKTVKNTSDYNKIISLFIDTVYNKTKIEYQFNNKYLNLIKENRIEEIENFSFLKDTLTYV